MSRALSAGRALAAYGAAAAGTRAAYGVLTWEPPGPLGTWDRVNHRGEPVTLLEGPAVAAGAAAAALVAPGVPARARLALFLAGAGAGALGCYDDLAGSPGRKGLRGHLGALARGEVTTGTVKLAGIGATALLAAALAGGRRGDALVNAGLVAGGANLVNLFDLRPGRAIKVTLAGAAALGAVSPQAAVMAAVPAGAAAAAAAEDLRERAMLGDCGANALGAMLGMAAASCLPRPARIGLLAAVAGLTVASEAVSFSKVIEAAPPLRWLDRLGRRPAGPDLGSGAPGAGSAQRGDRPPGTLPR